MMDDAGQPPIPSAPAIPERAGDRLRAAREARGMSLDDVALRTRVPLRHLEAIEASDYAGLPSHTYATGFAKAYARAVGADEIAIARQVRDEIDRVGHRAPEYTPYETADPARVPSRGVTIVALGLAVAVAVLAALWFLTDVFRGGFSRAGVAGTTVVAVPPVAAPGGVVVPVPAPSPTAPAGGAVVLTARDEVWMRVYDGANQTLYLGTLEPGETFVVPANAVRPMINVGRPDQLDVTLNGIAVPRLGDGRRAIKDLVIDGASIAARAAGAAAPTARPTAAPTAVPPPGASPVAASEPAARAPRPRPRPTPRRAALTETQRANLAAAANPPATAATPQP